MEENPYQAPDSYLEVPKRTVPAVPTATRWEAARWGAKLGAIVGVGYGSLMAIGPVAAEVLGAWVRKQPVKPIDMLFLVGQYFLFVVAIGISSCVLVAALCFATKKIFPKKASSP